MKKLLFFVSCFLVLHVSLAKAQLSYTHSTATPLAYSTFGLTANGGGSFYIYLNLPSSVIGHVLYASVRTEGAYSNDVNDHNEYGTSSGSFTGGTSTFIEYAIDYDDGTWETYSGYINAYQSGFEITGP